MALSSSFKVICDCGHDGKIKLRENDQPFSSMWEAYSVEGLNGSGFTATNAMSLPDVIKQMNLSCPKCNSTLTVRNVFEK